MLGMPIGYMTLEYFVLALYTQNIGYVDDIQGCILAFEYDPNAVAQ
jgi:hypothetical protein